MIQCSISIVKGAYKILEQAIDQIQKWAEETGKFEAIAWDKMPEIYLYMDQVITYMDKQLKLFERNENTRLLTSSMINNYVKDNVLERPEQKKYSKEHLAMLTMICMVKASFVHSRYFSIIKIFNRHTSKTELMIIFRISQAKV